MWLCVETRTPISIVPPLMPITMVLERETLLDADIAGGLLVEGSVALRCVRCGIALRWVFSSARRAGGLAWSACGWRRGAGSGGAGRADRGQAHDLAKLP
eukprot:579256-Prymnesium_polylepis.1